MAGIIMFIIKYVFRSLHLLSFALIFGNVCYDFYFGKRFAKVEGDAKLAIIASSVILIISGLVNMILLIVEQKYEKTSSYNLWKRLIILKFFLTFSLTPLLEKIFKLVGANEESCPNVRLGIMVILFLMSPFLRYYREQNLIPMNLNSSKF